VTRDARLAVTTQEHIVTSAQRLDLTPVTDERRRTVAVRRARLVVRDADAAVETRVQLTRVIYTRHMVVETRV